MLERDIQQWQRVIDGFQRASTSGDWQPWLEALAETLHPEIEWDASGVAMPDLAGVFHGPEAVVHWWAEWLAAWETVDFDYELTDAGDSLVFLLEQSMRGRASRGSRDVRRRGWDSNPRTEVTPVNGFQGRRIQPLCHPSGSDKCDAIHSQLQYKQ